jgi:hypothetical protein
MRRCQVDNITQHVHGQPVLRWQFVVVQEFIRRAAFLGEEHAHEVIIANDLVVACSDRADRRCNERPPRSAP